MRIREFARHSVTVTEPVIVNAYTKEREYLCSLEADRLLAGFREISGIPKRADCYPGGWEDEEYCGHTLGHYMVAMAQIYAKEQSADIKERLEYVLAELETSQRQSGYLFALDVELFDKLERGETYKIWYTMHKVVTGLIAVYELAGLEKALTIVTKLGDWILNRVLQWTDKEKRRVLCIADGGMNDCLYELYKITKDERYAEAAEKFENQDFFISLAKGNDVLPNKHAADTIPKILGALNRYLALGEPEEDYLLVAKNFFDIVVSSHTYITGGNGELLHFRAPKALAAERTQYNSETCSTAGMMKLAQRLYSVTGDKRYMDYYEQAYFNAMLGAQNPEDGMTAFFQPMAAGYFKTFSTPLSKFWCCTGTGMELFTDLTSSIYHTTEEGVYVNLYLSSVLEDKESGIKLTQKVDGDKYESAEFVLNQKGTGKTALYFRQPEWSGKDVEVTVNGTAETVTVKDGYLCLDSELKNGDRIVLTFHPELKMHALSDKENCIAVTYGPLVMAAGLGQEDMTTERMRRTNVTVPTKNVKVHDRIMLQEGLRLSDWFANYKDNFVKKDGELAFTLRGTDADEEMVFIPYYKIYNERYGIYFEFYDEENLPEDIRAMLEEQKRLEEERLALEAEAARLEEEARRRKEEEEQRRKDAERRAREEVRMREEEEERKRQEEARKAREEEYRLRRGIELQRQELQRRAEAEAEERERREDEERKRRAEEERKRREEEKRKREEEERRAATETVPDDDDTILQMSMEERFRYEQEEEKRKAAKAEEARRRAEEEAEAERIRKEEARKAREEEYRLRRGIDLQRQEMERRRNEGDDDRARRESQEAERIRKEEERKRREEEYRLFKERELQRQELERKREEDAVKRQEEEEKQRAMAAANELEKAELEAKKAAAKQLAEAERAAELAEAKMREEEANLQAARMAAERAELELAAQKAVAETELLRYELEAKKVAAQKVADAERAADLAEAKRREEEARLKVAKLTAERAELEASIRKSEAEAEAAKNGTLVTDADKDDKKSKGIFGKKFRLR